MISGGDRSKLQHETLLVVSLRHKRFYVDDARAVNTRDATSRRQTQAGFGSL